MKEQIRRSFTAAQNALADFLRDESRLQTISDIAGLIADRFRIGGKVLICGNGGSLCDAMHFAEELTGRFHEDRPALPAIALTDPAHITCVGNDYGFDQVFSRGVEAYARPEDVVIGISTSGNSANIINALEAARSLGCSTVALLGKDGGKLAGTCHHQLIVPATDTARIQEIHTMILHILIECIESKLFHKE